ncbi:DUF805 domain-containing protein [Escherichia coli]|uniref:DUF805 domain-containing protein n=1 Tax=Escherichia coli TaxID=562 RepID=UPI000BDF5232|nr:DUF805 domain-containing protein [Escherichia coli]EFL5622487.1 DUF805 domain-containing protein [Escherichia coli]EFR5459345.1 DUF805 domain-containing protein [Escherichia coli]ELS4759611.1 DUF805 domain-containing protein [Escherichia coli]HDQ5199792.1 DUF805 domain-containing protein [Escherichia coli]
MKKSPLAWYKDVLFNNYFNYSGRASRREFWWYHLFNLIFLGVLFCIDYTLNDAGISDGVYISSVYLLATFIPLFTLQVRRLHDIGLSAWYLFVWCIPYIGGFILFVMNCIPSEKGDNKYGAYRI